jgi:ATP-binding cassette subfamily B protein
MPPQKRGFFAPETLQISSMDCGVASVACLLEGYGVTPGYERLRKLCQTSVDGTSIDSLEELCNSFGIPVCQHVVPADGVRGAMEGRYPVIAIVQVNQYIPHFVTVWRRVGPYVQVMDPAGGRRWVRDEVFAKELFSIAFRLPREDWVAWFAGPNLFREMLETRARAFLSPPKAAALIAEVLERPVPERVAALDAALRFLERTVNATGNKPTAWKEALFDRALTSVSGEGAGLGPLPPQLWTISVESDGNVSTQGAVLLAPWDTEVSAGSASAAAEPPSEVDAESVSTPPGPLDRDESLFTQLGRVLRPEGRLLWKALTVGVLMLTLASTLELVIYRAAIDAPRLFPTLSGRMNAALLILTPALLILFIEVAVKLGGARLGRVIELQLRMTTLHALPRVDDHFVRSRPTSDLAYRAHNLVTGGQLPISVLAATRATGDLLVTLGAIAWLDVAYVAPVLLGGAGLVLAFYATRSRLRELNTRKQIHASRLLTIFLDVLRGLRPIRLHGYQDAFRIDQRHEIERWSDTSLAFLRARTVLDAINGLVSTALLAFVFFLFTSGARDPRTFILLALWAFRVPPIIAALRAFVESYPSQRIALTRLLEVTRYTPIADAGAGVNAQPISSPAATRVDAGVAICMRQVSVTANNNLILRDLSVEVRAGEHIAIVGRSGSGKSTLVSLLLGFQEATEGTVFVDERRLDARAVSVLRRETAWIDPSVQLWNTTVRANIDYAVQGFPRRSFLSVAEMVDLIDVLDHLDKGLDTPVGPEGTLVSGGEGQRIRAGRALLRDRVRLAVLDEAFRGLDRPTRKRLLVNARRAWAGATMFFVTHDIAHALEFGRVLVMDEGRIVEDGSPIELRQRASRFADLLRAEERALDELWGATAWRRVCVADGHIADEHDAG